MFRLLNKPLLQAGKNPILKIIASSLIGSAVALLQSSRSSDLPRGETPGWALAGGIAGFVAVLILTSPKIFFGSLFFFIGLLLAILSVNNQDGYITDLEPYLIKALVSSGFLIVGLLLFYRRQRKPRSVSSKDDALHGIEQKQDKQTSCRECD